MILFLGKDTSYLSDYHPAFALNQWKCGQQAHWEGIVVLQLEVSQLLYRLIPLTQIGFLICHDTISVRYFCDGFPIYIEASYFP